MLNYELVECKPTAEEYINLRKLVGWKTHDLENVKKGLKNSIYIVCAIYNNQVIGIARIVGDESICFYIQDVIVNPVFQRKGIGTAMMHKVLKYISKNACAGSFIGLMSSKGKESFYRKFGFWERPSERFGSGMMKYWELKV